MEGLLKFKGALRFDGHFKGEVKTSDTLIVGESGILDGTIEVGSFFNMGNVTGNIRATKKISILTGSKLTGNIDTPALVSEEGALFVGQCAMPESLPEKPEEEKESNLKRTINRKFQNLFTATGEKEEAKSDGWLSGSGTGAKKKAIVGVAASAILLLVGAGYFVIASKTSMGSTVLAQYLYERSAQDDPAKLTILADKYFSEGHYKRAVKAYLRLREISPPDPHITKKLAISLENSGDVSEAATYYEEAFKNEPDDKEILEKLGAFYKKAGNMDKLIGLREFTLEQHPANTDVAKELFRLYMETKNWDKGIQVYKDKIAASPKTIDDLLTIGGLQKRLGQLGEAIKTLTEAVNKNTSNVKAIVELGYAYHKAGQEEKSLDIFGFVVRIDPKHPEALINNGYTNLAMGKTEKAMEFFNKALADSPDNLRAFLGLAIAYSRLGNGEKAEQYCKQILEKDPDYSPALNRIAWLYAQQKRNMEEAEKYSVASMRYNENLPDYMDTLSEIYYQKQDYDKAIELIERAIKLRPANPYFKSQLDKFGAAKKRAASR